MKTLTCLVLVLLLALSAPAWASTRVQVVAPDGTITETQVDSLPVVAGESTYAWPEKQSSVPHRPGTVQTVNLDMEAYRLLGGSVYAGGQFAVVFRYDDDTSADITYRFDAENSTGRIELDGETGIFTVTEAGPFIIEIWADGRYALDARYANVGAQMPDLAQLRANGGGAGQTALDAAAREVYALEAVRRTNAQRAENGLPALRVDRQLMSAADQRVAELPDNFSHTRPDGQSASSWVQEITGAVAAGENIAMGQTSPQGAVAGWMESSGHRENILSGNYTRVGVSCHEAADGTIYWVQLFAA